MADEADDLKERGSGLAQDPQRGSDDWIGKVKRHIEAQSEAGSTEPLNLLSQVLGLFTTVFGKLLLGFLFGWINPHVRVRVEGHIKGDWKSSDGFITLDIEIEFNGRVGKIELQNLAGEWKDGIVAAMIRAEIKPKVGKQLSKEKKKQLKTCTWVRMSGALMWDRDGFWEIHPESGEDIEIEVGEGAGVGGPPAAPPSPDPYLEPGRPKHGPGPGFEEVETYEQKLEKSRARRKPEEPSAAPPPAQPPAGSAEPERHPKNGAGPGSEETSPPPK